MNYAEKLSGREAALIIGIAGKYGFIPKYENSFESNVNEALSFLHEDRSADYRLILQKPPKKGEIFLDQDYEKTICLIEEKEGDTLGYGINLESGLVVRYYFPQF